jgi:hypothetical protein
MSTRNITVRSAHSGEYTARWWTVTKELEAMGAKAFGSLQRREERLERFRLAAAKKEAKQKASLERLEEARRQETETVAARMRTRSAELRAEQVLEEHLEFVTSGMEAEEFLQWKLSDAWVTYRRARSLEEGHTARELVNRAMKNLRDFHDGNPLHVLAATAEMINECGSGSDSEDSDYTEGSA